MARHVVFAAGWLVAIVFAAVPAFAMVASAIDGFDPSANDVVSVVLAQPDGKVLVGGEFTQISGTTCGRLARLNTSGIIDTSFKLGAGAVGANPAVEALALQTDGKILVGGVFDSFNGVTANGLVRLKTDGSVDTSFSFKSGGTVTCLAIRPDGKILVGGDLYGTQNLVLINSDGSLNTSFAYDQDPACRFSQIAILKDGKLLLGGKKRLFPNGAPDPSYILGFAAPETMNALAVQPDGRILLGGEFAIQLNGQTCGGIARVNENGSVDTTFKPGSGADAYPKVQSIALLPDGRIMAGGQFSSFNGARSIGLVRLNHDGSVDKTFDLGHDAGHWAGTIHVQPDGNILIGGYFESVGETPRKNIARLNRMGLLDTNFNSASGINEVVRAVVRQADGKVVIGGNFTNVFGVERNRIARLDGSGVLDASFNAGTGPNGIVYAMVQQPDGKIIAAGDFQSVAGQARSYVARLTTDGSLDDTFHPGRIDRVVTTLALQPDGKLLIGGRFTRIYGDARRGIARLKTNGSIDATFVPGINANYGVNAFAIQPDGKILVGGYRLFARMNGDGSIDTSFGPGAVCEQTTAISVLTDGGILVAGNNFTNTSSDFYASSIVMKLKSDGSLDPGFHFTPQKFMQILAIAQRPDGKIQIGGDFDAIDGVSRNHIAQLNSDGSLDTSFNPGAGADGTVYTILPQSDNKSIIGGNFNTVNTLGKSKLARLNANGSVDTSFSSGCGANQSVFVLALDPDEKVVVGGAFTAMNNIGKDRICRLDHDGWLDPAFQSSAATNGNVFCAAAQPDGKTILGGAFTTVNGATQNRLARLKSDGSLDATFKTGTGANDTVYSLASQTDGKTLLAGEFTQFNGADRSRVARLNADGSLDSAFKPGAFDQPVSAMALQRDGKIIVAGEFTKNGNTPCTHIARLNANGSLDAKFASKTSIDRPPDAAIIQPDGKIILAGQFSLVNGTTRRNIARLNSDGSLDAAFDAKIAPDQGSIFSLALQSDGKILIAGDFKSINQLARNRLARLNPDGSLDQSYHPGTGADGAVLAIALNSDGKLLAGGDFANLNGVPRNRLARITNPTGATQTLTVTDNETVTWSLGGSFPQPSQVLFEHSYDGSSWQKLGWGAPNQGGYKLTGLRLPTMNNHYIRVTGYATCGLHNGSILLTQSTLLAYVTPRNAACEWVLYR